MLRDVLVDLDLLKIHPDLFRSDVLNVFGNEKDCFDLGKGFIKILILTLKIFNFFNNKIYESSCLSHL